MERFIKEISAIFSDKCTVEPGRTKGCLYVRFSIDNPIAFGAEVKELFQFLHVNRLNTWLDFEERYFVVYDPTIQV